jgi:cell cycle sensor histidine kinase DivJ
LKFTPHGGRVVVSGRCERGEVVLGVADTGVGVAEQDLPHLGDPFFQASASYGRNFEGTGLGLSVVKGLVGLHGGSFTVDSALGAGTRVVVRLPLQPQDGGGTLEKLDPRKSGPDLPIEQRMRIRA